jgi:molybdopterin-guanine dinucleotide biosynthesis protein A
VTGAILLAGGRATRVDGEDKPRFEVAGATLFAHAQAAVADCTPITAVGAPIGTDPEISWTREEPRYGGPAAGVVAALAHWRANDVDDPEWTFVLACDVPGVRAATERLRAARDHLPSETDGVCLTDAGSRPQWLLGLYRTAALRRRADALADAGHGASIRDLLDGLAVAVVRAPADETDDIDTWDDLARARRKETQT